jgi:superfamily II DNA or RNA helicase
MSNTSAPKTLRPHQAPAVDRVVEEFTAAGADRATVVMMCGTGKTLTGQRMTERLIEEQIVPATGRVLMLFPSLALVQQTYDGWLADQTLPFRAIAFCSATRKEKGEDGIDASTLPLDNTTDPADLAKWLIDEEADDMLSVVFGTYHSSPRIAEMHADLDVPAWDLVICDEAHNTTGDLTGPFATALHQDKIPAARRVFMTATPKVHTKRGRKIANAAEAGIASMNDTAVYGRRAYEYPLPQAIADKVLNDYEVVVMAVSDTDVRDFLRTNPNALGTDGARYDEAVTAIAMLRASQQYDLHRLLTFHNTVARAEDYARHLDTIVDNLPADALPAQREAMRFLTVSGADTGEYREQVKRALGSTSDAGYTVLSNCKVFAEGVDVPTLDGLVLADERRSPVEVTQIVGRIIRKNDQRPDAKSMMILPVVIKDGEDPEQAVAGGTFTKVWDTLLALAEHDTDMAADLENALRAKHGLCPLDEPAVAATATAPVISSVPLSDPVESPADRSLFAEPIPAAMTDADQEPASSPEPAKSLRKVTIIGTDDALDPAGILQAFTSIAVDRTSDTWEQNRAAVEAYATTHGSWPSKRARDTETRRIGNWLSNQRAAAKGKGKGKGAWSEQREQAMDAMSERVGMDWRGENPDDTWGQNRAAVEAYATTHGSWPSTTSKDTEVKRLGQWLSRQRQAAEGKGTWSWSEQREQALDAMSERVGMDWRGVNDDDIWEQNRASVEAYATNHGSWPSTIAKDPEDRRFGVWLSNERGAAKGKGAWSEQRERAMDAMSERVGMDWRDGRARRPVSVAA